MNGKVRRSDKVLGQAGKPRGILGRYFGFIMARHNRPDGEWTLDLLAVQDDDRVLEVGFGPGVAIDALMRARPSVHVTGVDHSDEMYRAASNRNRQAIDRGRVDLLLASADELPFADGSFDCIFSIHCIYFWDDPVMVLRELRRVLRPGGRIAITVRDRQREAYQPFRSDGLEEKMRQAGFGAIAIKSNDSAAHALLCAIGTK